MSVLIAETNEEERQELEDTGYGQIQRLSTDTSDYLTRSSHLYTRRLSFNSDTDIENTSLIEQTSDQAITDCNAKLNELSQ